MTPTDRLILALDVRPRRAIEIIEATRDLVGCYKIGPRLWFYPNEGGWWLPLMIALGHDVKIFWDWKGAETSDTTAWVIAQCGDLHISYLSITPRPGEVECPFPHPPTISLLARLMLSDDIDATTLLLADRWAMTGLPGYQGVICPPSYIPRLRKWEVTLPVFSPGIRLPGQNSDNHVAAFTPGDAIAAGADYVIVGRPITQADDPRAACQAVLDDIARGMKSRS